MSRGDPAGESRGGSPTARGKRVPEVEINVQIVQAIKIDKLDFHRVCLQSESPIFYNRALFSLTDDPFDPPFLLHPQINDPFTG
ncbi:hypothetical protein EI200_16365 [Peribacillus simplex]|uniref:hypothetical protein n=1 Tax=Peribacillus simplex TaxID=1478 RepID=UPI000F63BA4E|nr:hypothetical protein [Peribacillus simplex]RRN69767.1 hypothetical protein EI200_16365 [Peribacillus simplex]